MASKATSIRLFSFSTPPIRACHLTWMAFFVGAVVMLGVK